MTRLRLLGPRALLSQTVGAIQDEGIVQLAEAPCPAGLAPYAADAIVRRRRHHLTHALARVEDALALLATLGANVQARDDGSITEARAARLSAHVLAEATRLAARARSLTDERDVLRTYEPLFADLEALFVTRGTKQASVYLLRLRTHDALAELRVALEKALGNEYELRSHQLATGESMVLLLVAAARGEQLERQLAAAHVERASLPAALGDLDLADALPRMRPRLIEVMRELDSVRSDAAALARAYGDDLARGRRILHDALLLLDAEQRAATSSRVFVLEGWLPARDRHRLAAAIERKVGPLVSIEEIDSHEWEAGDAPVKLANPRFLAPFEILTSLLPLPLYGSVDPTPFVAVFFPMLFGVIVGDVGYGLVLLVLAAVLRLGWRSSRLALDVSRIALAVSVYAIIFGVCYGEAFGDLGARFVGMHPLWFDRREAVLAFLVLAIALGAVHLIVGLVVAAAHRWRRDRRVAIGRGLTAVMLVLLALSLLALFERVPAVLLMPAVSALLAAFAVIIVLEGASAILEFMSVVNHVLSYARVMALGTASVMLAIVANRMQGAFGSLALGVAFALVFHVINFAITLFSPTIHVMRLHYVEFFGTFFEPGGGPYRPLRHWSPAPAPH
ncbi:MAG TPA: V-type ATPase 116kDa subunit family protein [Kofleriaceae bacterium]